MRRVVVVGASGAGKSTLARELARRFDLRYVELDALHWGPNWTETPTEALRAKVEAAIACDRWAICGNYTKLRASIWPRADTLIWLDYPMPLVMWRVLRRTIQRNITGETLWSNNMETWQKSFFSTDSIIVWAWTSWRTQRRNYSRFFRTRDYPDLRRYRFVSPAQTRNWLEQISG
jgi:adenylate kinase family enzyme